MAAFNRDGKRFHVNAAPAGGQHEATDRRPMTDLKGRLGEAAAAAFAEEGLDGALGRVTPSDRPDLADFQCNGALAAAKQAKANPREIAGRIAERLKADPAVASVEIAGPGFINLRVSPTPP